MLSTPIGNIDFATLLLSSELAQSQQGQVWVIDDINQMEIAPSQRELFNQMQVKSDVRTDLSQSTTNRITIDRAM
jgi:hypothetical protein